MLYIATVNVGFYYKIKILRVSFYSYNYTKNVDKQNSKHTNKRIMNYDAINLCHNSWSVYLLVYTYINMYMYDANYVYIEHEDTYIYI